ncbi:MAG: hypothetical protein FJ145_26550 [Deltaproteobacteria bacterium]|nr:hypothetical protein [Deltaproteobacteria bacterium]
MAMATFAAMIMTVFLNGCSTSMTGSGPVTAYEGARVIVGDGRTIDNATLLVQGDKITQVGRAADVSVPAGAARVNLAGKTVMPTIVDTHVHLSREREAIIRDLRQRAYYGVNNHRLKGGGIG